jgi:hypothetical protein
LHIDSLATAFHAAQGAQADGNNGVRGCFDYALI